LASILRLWALDPLLMQQLQLAQIGGSRMMTTAALRRALFRPDTAPAALRGMLGQFQPESASALLDLTWFGLPGPTVTAPCPMLLLGGELDALVNLDDLRATASAYGLEPEVLAGMPHAMMLDPEWQRPAERILAWLQSLPA
jgi:alpha-beta hydrolase superfamily lysophospholipase